MDENHQDKTGNNRRAQELMQVLVKRRRVGLGESFRSGLKELKSEPANHQTGSLQLAGRLAYYAGFLAALPVAFFSKYAAIELLFDGRITAKHKTKYMFEQLNDRYKESIKGFNLAVAFNIGFTMIALYAFFILPPAKEVTIPFLGLSVPTRCATSWGELIEELG